MIFGSRTGTVHKSSDSSLKHQERDLLLYVCWTKLKLGRQFVPSHNNLLEVFAVDVYVNAHERLLVPKKYG